MKGQLSFEFYFAFLIFVIFVAYIVFQIIVRNPNYAIQVGAQSIRLNAWRVSELLVNDNGEPMNWPTSLNPTKRLGLSDETANKTNMLSSEKIAAFISRCFSNYQETKDLLGLDTNAQMIVTISNIATNSPPMICTPQASEIISKGTEVVSITRIAAVNDGTYANITVTVW